MASTLVVPDLPDGSPDYNEVIRCLVEDFTRRAYAHGLRDGALALGCELDTQSLDDVEARTRVDAIILEDGTVRLEAYFPDIAVNG